MRHKLFPKDFETPTLLYGLVVKNTDKVKNMSCKNFIDKNQNVSESLRTQVEFGMVKINKKKHQILKTVESPEGWWDIRPTIMDTDTKYWSQRSGPFTKPGT